MMVEASRSRSARVVVGAWAVTGAAALALAALRLWVTGWPSATETMCAVVFAALMVASRLRPVVLHLGDRSDAFDLDEGFFVLLVLLVPAAMTVVVFAAASIVAQALTRRPPAESVFGVGRVVTATGAAALVFVLVRGGQASPGYVTVGAALVGALCCLVVNTGAVVSILSALGHPWREAVFGALAGKLLVAVVSIALAIPTALLLAHRPEFLPLVVLSLLALRYLGEDHAEVRHDRMRWRGLFEAALDVNRSLGGDETRAAVLVSAGSLLRSAEVSLTAGPPPGRDGTLTAPVELADRRLWLSVSGRSRTEPFGDGDRALLGALASVGAIALSNVERHAEVERQKDSLSVITSSLGEGVCAISRTGAITFMNPSGAGMLAWPDDIPTGDGLLPLPVETPRFLLDPAQRAMSLRQNVVTEDTRFVRLDGTPFPVTMTASPVLADGPAPAAVVVFRDASRRKAFEEQLARHAFLDPLTGLANRRLLLDHLDHALLQADRTGGRVAVLFGDIDRFKVVNDNLGHQVGDEMLRVVAERLRRAVRPGDTLSRFGGDEFVIVLEGLTSPEDAGQVADRVRHALREPIVLGGGHEVVATMSIGLALSDADTSRDDLVHDADVAMYRAKERGRAGRVTLFDVDQMGGRPAARLELDTAIHHAVEREELEVYFQPLLSLAEKQIVGAEALVRWDHPEHGILSPAHFIELAEDNGTIVSIGRAVLEQACRRAKAWLDTDGVRLEVGVNLSARQFRDAGLEEQIATVLETTGLDPAQLCLEITESLAMRDVELTAAVLAKLHGLGLRLAIDDFGTGHSSLGYLARFPIDVIKVDQSFVRSIDQDPVKSAIVSAVVALSKAIGATTVVEGVETLAELEQVAGLGCDAAQGFYFSRPLPADAFGALLRSGSAPGPPRRAPAGRLLTG